MFTFCVCQTTLFVWMLYATIIIQFGTLFFRVCSWWTTFSLSPNHKVTVVVHCDATATHRCCANAQQSSRTTSSIHASEFMRVFFLLLYSASKRSYTLYTIRHLRRTGGSLSICTNQRVNEYRVDIYLYIQTDIHIIRLCHKPNNKRSITLTLYLMFPSWMLFIYAVRWMCFVCMFFFSLLLFILFFVVVVVLFFVQCFFPHCCCVWLLVVTVTIAGAVDTSVMCTCFSLSLSLLHTQYECVCSFCFLLR